MKTTIIAEIGINHNGSVDIAKQLIESAKNAGADVCKFQTHMPENQMLRTTKSADYVKEDIYGLLNSVRLSQKDHETLKNFCDEMDIEFLSTPFSKNAAQLLNEIGVKRFKIGSGELTKYDLLDYIFQLNKPVILSTGMSNLEIVQNTIKYLSKYSNSVSLLHCTSLYPPEANQVNIKMITKYKELFPELKIGYSDHTSYNYASFAAVSLGAEIIEKHFTLDKNMDGPDHAISCDPNDLKDLVKGIRYIEQTLNETDKIIYEKEQQVIDMARHSLVSTKDIQPGEKLTHDNLGTKRPGTGIPAEKYYDFLNKEVINFVPKDSLIDIDNIN